MAVTRITGYVAAAGVVLTNTEVFGNLPTGQKLWVSTAIVGVFAFIAAADALARAYVTGNTVPQVSMLPSPTGATRLTGKDESGWKAIAVRIDPKDSSTPEFWIIKSGQDATWVKGTDLKLGI